MIPTATKQGPSPLQQRFALAGLALELTQRPIIGTDPAIFGMDIQRRANQRHEFYRIWRGATDNRVEVLGTDAKLCQLVLLVHEPVRTFEVRVHHRAVRSDDPRIVRRDGRFHYMIREQTRDSKRHYLCGYDERHLFIGELPRGVSTVRDAHRVLKADDVVQAERTRHVKRQGEWFFLELTPEEVAQREASVKHAVVRHRVPIGVGGNPHVADELVRILRPTSTRRAREFDVYVRGRVRHVDHKTVTFESWRRVLRNTEPHAEQRMPGIAWID